MERMKSLPAQKTNTMPPALATNRRTTISSDAPPQDFGCVLLATERVSRTSLLADGDKSDLCCTPAALAAMSESQEGLRHRRAGHTIPPVRTKDRGDTTRSPERNAAAFASTASRPQKEFITADAVVLCVLSLLAILTRFYRIAEPPAIVFDEIHFQKFVDRHLARTWYFDIHPPLGKLILAYGGLLLGYRPDPSFIGTKIGDLYPPSINFRALRYVSAMFGSATVPMSYLVGRALAQSRVSSLLCGFLVLTDVIGTIEARLILLDSQLFFFSQLSLLLALKLWQARPGSRKRWTYVLVTGAACGLAISIKHTALATPGLIAIVSFLGGHFLEEPLALPECLVAGITAITAYSLPFYPLLTRQWTTGDKYDNFMPPEFRRTLRNAAEYDPAATRPSFWRMLVKLNHCMVTSNASVKQRHAWESYWYEWIINWRGVLYYTGRVEESGEAPHDIIYLIGNPAVCIITLACLIIFTVLSVVIARLRAFPKSRDPSIVPMSKVLTGAFLLGGWICNLAPYALIERSSFLYHYIPGLFYAQLLCGSTVDMLPARLRTVVVAVFCATALATFVYWSPWIYALPLTRAEHAARQLLPKWN